MGGIDFVIPWVDGSDPEWRARKAAYTGSASTDDRRERYRDWGLLPHWFRAVERFAPWVRRIWFICDQTPPAWLNTNHPKLKIIRHEDYLPEAYRPAFSSHPIELNLHRIEGLAERFVYFNDDTFLIRSVKEDFFFRDGLPRDCALLNAVPTDDLVRKDPDARVFTLFLNVASYINRDYDFRRCMRRNWRKWFSPCYGKDLFRNAMLGIWPRFVGSVEPHLPQAFLKSSFERAWEQDFDILDATSRRHLRDDRDVNQWLIRQRQLMEGRFVVRRPVRDAVFPLDQEDAGLHDTIRRQLKPMICLNDATLAEDAFERKRRALIGDFDAILGQKSEFEA